LPGAVNTDMLIKGLERDNFNNDTSIRERLENFGKKQCIGRIGEPIDIANLIIFLTDNNKSGYITGQSFIIDGGATIKLSTE